MAARKASARAFRISAQARADIEEILDWTDLQFGAKARLRYEALLEAALRDLAQDIQRAGVRPRPEFGRGAMTYHIHFSRAHVGAQTGRVNQPRHLLFFRVDPSNIEIARVLHDAMELKKHVPDE